MRYPGDRHVLPLFGPWRWAPYMRGKFYWKKYQNARSFFLSHTTKLNQQKQWNVVPKSTAKIDPYNKYNIFPSFIIDQSWNTLQLKNIVLSFHPPFEPITALFTFTGLWPTVRESVGLPRARGKLVNLQIWSVSITVVRFIEILKTTPKHPKPPPNHYRTYNARKKVLGHSRPRRGAKRSPAFLKS